MLQLKYAFQLKAMVRRRYGFHVPEVYVNCVYLRRAMTALAMMSAVLLVAGCEGAAGPKGDAGAACTAVDNADGSITVNCGGTTVKLAGKVGAAGASCAIKDNGDGTKTITCGESKATVSDGKDGAAGSAGAAGSSGKDGSSCVVKDNGDKTKTITCGDGTAVTLADGATGTQGPAGQPGAAGKDLIDAPPAAYLAADGIKGGAAFSEWFTATGAGKGKLTDYGVTNGSEFVRCKTCHGWDGLGNAGSYADRTGLSTGTATRPDVSDVNLRVSAKTMSYQDLHDMVAAPWGRPMNAAGDSRHPDYSGSLTEAQIWNMVKFMKEEWIAPNDLYDLQVSGAPMHYEMVNGVNTLIKPKLTYTNIGKDGDAVAGKVIYKAKCESCHGVDGKTVAIESMSLGQFVRAKPHESWFKTKFGQSTVMAPGLVTATKDHKDLYKLMADPTAFPNL
jgi:hypothetical protein